MRNFLLLLLLLAGLPQVAQSQNSYFPPTTGATWDTVQPISLGWCPDRVDSLVDYVGARNSRAFIVLKGGKIVVEEYYGNFTRDSLWYWASAGKTLTAFTVGIAQSEGHLSIQDTTSDYLGTGWTACSPQQEEKITIRHQLTMTSGLDDGVPDHYCTLDTCLQYIADAGTRWAYHNGPYTLLDGVISNATGQTLNTYFTQKVKNPTGMTGIFVQSGYNNVYVSNARSMARFGLLVLNRGNWNGTQVLSDTTYFNQMVNTSQNINPSYGYLWWLNGKSSFKVPGFQVSFPGSYNPSAPADMYAAIGKNGQLINIVPSQDLVFIRMGDAADANDVSFTLNDTIWQKLNLAMISCAPTNIQNAELAPSFKIYPNPTADILQVSGGITPYDISIYDAFGRQVLQQSDNIDNINLNVSHLPTGTYWLQINRQHDKIQYKKILILR
jgi:CubicO group peptidase (beta-lactamase class C family)